MEVSPSGGARSSFAFYIVNHIRSPSSNTSVTLSPRKSTPRANVPSSSSDVPDLLPSTRRKVAPSWITSVISSAEEERTNGRKVSEESLLIPTPNHEKPSLPINSRTASVTKVDELINGPFARKAILPEKREVIYSRDNPQPPPPNRNNSRSLKLQQRRNSNRLTESQKSTSDLQARLLAEARSKVCERDIPPRFTHTFGASCLSAEAVTNPPGKGIRVRPAVTARLRNVADNSADVVSRRSRVSSQRGDEMSSLRGDSDTIRTARSNSSVRLFGDMSAHTRALNARPAGEPSILERAINTARGPRTRTQDAAAPSTPKIEQRAQSAQITQPDVIDVRPSRPLGSASTPSVNPRTRSMSLRSHTPCRRRDVPQVSGASEWSTTAVPRSSSTVAPPRAALGLGTPRPQVDCQSRRGRQSLNVDSFHIADAPSAKSVIETSKSADRHWLRSRFVPK